MRLLLGWYIDQIRTMHSTMHSDSINVSSILRHHFKTEVLFTLVENGVATYDSVKHVLVHGTTKQVNKMMRKFDLEDLEDLLEGHWESVLIDVVEETARKGDTRFSRLRKICKDFDGALNTMVYVFYYVMEQSVYYTNKSKIVRNSDPDYKEKAQRSIINIMLSYSDRLTFDVGKSIVSIRFVHDVINKWSSIDSIGIGYLHNLFEDPRYVELVKRHGGDMYELKWKLKYHAKTSRYVHIDVYNKMYPSIRINLDRLGI